MKKILWICAVPLLVLSSCTKHIEKYNDETKRPVEVTGGPLLTNATINLVDGLASASVNTNVFRFTVQQWAMTTYQDEVNYDFFTRRIPDAWWSRYYKDVLADLKAAKAAVTAIPDKDILPEVRANQAAVIDITEVLSYSILVNSFGNIPYSQAVDIGNVFFPEYDDASTVFSDLLTRLNADIAAITPAAEGFEPAQDLLGGGDMAKWFMLANSLKLRMGMTLADIDPSTAKTAVEEAAPNVISSNDENVFLSYLESPPNSNPLYDDIVLGNRREYIATELIMEYLQGWSDPRIDQFFVPNTSAGEFAGSISGKVSTRSSFSLPNGNISNPTAPALVFDWTEMEFLKAEAIERGFAVEGTAEGHYNDGIKASIFWWMVNINDSAEIDAQAAVDAYLAQPGVAYATAAGDWKEKIGTQKWLGLYNRPYEAWTEQRRLDYPVLKEAFAPISGYPNRLPYPAIEQQVNGGSYTKAAAEIGGDKVEVKLFWDIN